MLDYLLHLTTWTVHPNSYSSFCWHLCYMFVVLLAGVSVMAVYFPRDSVDARLIKCGSLHYGSSQDSSEKDYCQNTCPPYLISDFCPIFLSFRLHSIHFIYLSWCLLHSVPHYFNPVFLFSQLPSLFRFFISLFLPSVSDISSLVLKIWFSLLLISSVWNLDVWQTGRTQLNHKQ